MTELLNTLNEEQKNTRANFGKTCMFTNRIVHLIEEGIEPFSILVFTATNKIASEMKESIIKLAGNEARNIWMGTIHSIFAKILRFEAEKLGYISSFAIYDTDDSKCTIKQIIKSLNLDSESYNVSYVLERISMAKNNLISAEDYLNNTEIQQADQTSCKPMIGKVYMQYNQHLRNSMAMDLDDLLYNMNVLFRDFPDVLVKYQERFRHIFIDKNLNANFLQHIVIKKIAESSNYSYSCRNNLHTT